MFWSDSLLLFHFYICNWFLLPAGEGASSQSVGCQTPERPCNEFKVKFTIKKPPSVKCYKCSKDQTHGRLKLTRSGQECSCSDTCYFITDGSVKKTLECKLRTCLPNGKSQTGRYHMEENYIDSRLFLGLTVGLKSIHKNLVIIKYLK